MKDLLKSRRIIAESDRNHLIGMIASKSKLLVENPEEIRKGDCQILAGWVMELSNNIEMLRTINLLSKS